MEYPSPDTPSNARCVSQAPYRPAPYGSGLGFLLIHSINRDTHHPTLTTGR
ncbi:hypothetical protein SEA_COEUR_23 [Gordonia phage Coeur]|uniref:Uncharacterized protein n=1 Tax=Gordonia phage Coeur TaxID=2571246 RepID=A0A4Y6EQQ2_9CAUD|nr:hypothetical protein PQC60_gp23 [Gordonia phage Coeur]QDF17444.1 hypothetical protein SEA_COEUR_23 [Gordonia phage Coeur]